MKTNANKIDYDKKFKIITCGYGFRSLLELEKHDLKFFKTKQDLIDYFEKDPDGIKTYEDDVKKEKIKEKIKEKYENRIFN